MLVVKVFIWPYGNAQQEREIGRTYISNDGTEQSLTHGNYRVVVMKQPDGIRTNITDQLAFATVVGFPRGPRNLWPLIKHALDKARPILRMRKPESRSHGAEGMDP